MEEMIRLIASVFEYSLTDIYRMNIVEFFRDFKRAEKVMEQRKKMAEKWTK